MRSSLISKIAGLAVALGVVCYAAIPAKADDFGKRFTIDIAPNWNIATTGDAYSLPPPGRIAVGYQPNDLPITNDLLLNYGIDYRIDQRTHLNYSHASFDLTFGRVLSIPGISLINKDVDRTDTISVNHTFGGGLTGALYYFDHQRQNVQGSCNNQIFCVGPNGTNIPNPDSIDEHGYGVHGAYNFGPESRIGKLFVVGVDAKYIPRPAVAPPGASLNGLGAYPGSGWEFPYSIQMRLPLVPDRSIFPFIGYERATAYFRGESSVEQYNQTNFGVVKFINREFSLSVVNVNFVECRCSDTVPPPDNIRFSNVILTLDYHQPL